MHIIPVVHPPAEAAHVAARPVAPLGLAGIAWIVARPSLLVRDGTVAPVGVWIVDLDDPRAPAGVDLTDGVASGERARARRRRSRDDAQRWLRSHYALRRILGACQDQDPLAIVFGPSASGQPQIEGAPGLAFSLAHSQGRALIAVSRAGAVGVDVERTRTGFHEMAIAQRIIGGGARAALEQTEPSHRTEAFFRLWVRHEAAVKCRGVGLVAAINRDLVDDLIVTDVDAGPGYAAAWALDAATSPVVTPLTYEWSN
jgi:4'-phosphopantetheinyl transferase